MAKLVMMKTATGEFGTPPIGCAGIGINLDEDVVIIHENGDEEVMDGLTQTLLNDRVVHVNQSYEADVPARRVFTTKAAADAYIAALTGASEPTTANHWCIEFGGGYVDEDCVAYPYVDLLLKPGTVLKSLVSAVPYADYNVWDCRVFGGGEVKLLSVAEGMVIAFESCAIGEIQPVEGDGNGYVHIEDCWVFGGDLSNTLQPILGWNNARLFASKSALSGLSGIYLVNGMVAKTETFDVTDLPSTMIGGYISAAGIRVLDGNSTNLYGTNVDGAIDVEAGATLRLYPGTYCKDAPVPLDPTAVITDYRSTFGKIYYYDGSGGVSIPTGATYQKIESFTHELEGRNCTTDVANSKIILTTSGYYQISAEFTTICGGNGVVLETAVHIDGVVLDSMKMKRKYQLSGDEGHGHMSDIVYIDCSGGDVELDVRARHDDENTVAFTAVNGKLHVVKIGE